MPKGAWSISRIFFSRAWGAWSVAMISIVPSLSPPMTASTSLQVRSGGFILKLESNDRSSSSVSVKWCGQASAVTRTPRRWPSRTSSTERAVEMCWMCSRPPVISARRMSRATMMSSAAAGMPARPSRIDSNPSFITPPTVSSGTWQCCMITRSNILAYSSARRISAAEATGAPSSVKATAPPATSWPSSASSSPLRPLLTAPTGIDVGLPRPLRLEDDELGGRLGVDRRHGVGHAGDRGHAAGQGGARAGGDRLVLLVARLAEVDVDVDQARADDLALGIDDDLGFFVALAHAAGSGRG